MLLREFAPAPYRPGDPSDAGSELTGKMHLLPVASPWAPMPGAQSCSKRELDVIGYLGASERTPMKIDPFVVMILFVAALPTVAISMRSASGWRAGVVFAAFYPALVIVVGVLMIATFVTLAAFGLIDLD
ncbi:hypothetical protein HYPDE_24448 [Hyphomicrobium denitrificans 1NES1]|uniref:Uncharacterized protein n=2 Tax=Hyphomicrobium denitrificans TaxID=53399 RepID=N0B950_9HYPH|nr:hypothetical protein HYPDE_24448 [Hyphomicrobium denitrificans 1NES1]